MRMQNALWVLGTFLIPFLIIRFTIDALASIPLDATFWLPSLVIVLFLIVPLWIMLSLFLLFKTKRILTEFYMMHKLGVSAVLAYSMMLGFFIMSYIGLFGLIHSTDIDWYNWHPYLRHIWPSSMAVILAGATVGLPLLVNDQLKELKEESALELQRKNVAPEKRDR